MIPAKQKADELIEKFRKHAEGCITWGDSGFVFNQKAQTESAKACAMICVEEITDALKVIDYRDYPKQYKYWQQVKTSIENE